MNTKFDTIFVASSFYLMCINYTLPEIINNLNPLKKYMNCWMKDEWWILSVDMLFTSFKDCVIDLISADRIENRNL